MDILDPKNTEDFDCGYEDGCVAFSCGEKNGDLVGRSEDYMVGFLVGFGDAMAVSEGYEAAERGVFFCPYGVGTDNEYLRKLWMSGYAEAVSDNAAAHRLMQ